MKQQKLDKQYKALIPKKEVLLKNKITMKNCPNCGFITNKSIRFCPHCQENDVFILLSSILNEQ